MATDDEVISSLSQLFSYETYDISPEYITFKNCVIKKYPMMHGGSYYSVGEKLSEIIVNRKYFESIREEITKYGSDIEL